MRILIVEDEVSIINMLSTGLQQAGYLYDSVETIAWAEHYLNLRSYDLVLMDWMLSDGSSEELIAEIKANYPKTAVIILSHNDNPEVEINAFKSGADDFVRKPFDIRVLLARVQAAIRGSGGDILTIGDLRIDNSNYKLFYKDNPVNLTGKAFDVLSLLARYKDEIVSKDQLLDALWEEPDLTLPSVIDNVINSIRTKVDKPLGITTIETIRSRGYRFCYQNDNSE